MTKDLSTLYSPQDATATTLRTAHGEGKTPFTGLQTLADVASNFLPGSEVGALTGDRGEGTAVTDPYTDHDPRGEYAPAYPETGGITIDDLAVGAMAPEALGALHLYKPNSIRIPPDATVIPGELLRDLKMYHSSNADFHPSSGFRGGADIGMRAGESGYGGQMSGNGVYADDNQIVNLLGHGSSLMEKGGRGHMSQYIAEPRPDVNNYAWINRDATAKDLLEDYPEFGHALWSSAGHPELNPAPPRTDLQSLSRYGASPEVIARAEEAMRKPDPLSVGQLIQRHMNARTGRGMDKDQSRRAVQELMLRHDVGGVVNPTVLHGSPLSGGAHEWSFTNPSNLEIVDKQKVTRQDLDDLRNKLMDRVLNAYR